MKTFKNLSTTIYDDNSNVNSTLPMTSSKHPMRVFIRIGIKGRERERERKKDNKLEYKSGIKSNAILLENVIVVKNQRAKISISIFGNIRLRFIRYILTTKRNILH